MFLHIHSVRYCGDYSLECGFTNGETLRVDLRNELYGEMFAPLLNKTLFQQVRINPDTQTVEWENGADFAPEFLYEVAQQQLQYSQSLSIP